MTRSPSVRSIVGYVLKDARRLNRPIDSLALDRLITREATSVGLSVKEGWLSTTEDPDAGRAADSKE